MKRVLLIALSCFIALQSFSQATIIGIYAGGGISTTYNYDVAPSGGLELLFTGHRGGRLFIGADIFYQSYSLYVDNEANGAKGQSGYAGINERFNAPYAYVAPKFSYGLGRQQNVKLYVTIGIGYNIGGFDSLRKWDYSYYTPAGGAGSGQYDSVLNNTKNINKMMVRASFGLTEYAHLGGNWFMTFTEDYGFVASSLTQTGTSSDPSRTQYNPNGLRPGYISLQIGISHHHVHDRYN